MGKSICPGCSLILDSIDEGLDTRFNASCACRAHYDELSSFTLSLADPDFIYQLIVDAYCAQHVGPNVKPISVAFSLIGLYLVCERGYSGRQVQLAHIALAKKSKAWPRFTPPPPIVSMTVLDVLNGINSENYGKRIFDWAKSVWKLWENSHASVAKLAKKHLDFV